MREKIKNRHRRGVVATTEVVIGLFPFAWIVGLVLVLSFWFWVTAVNEVATMHQAYAGKTNPSIYADVVGSSIGRYAQYYLSPSVNESNERYGRVWRYTSGKQEQLELWLPLQSLRGNMKTDFLSREEGFYKQPDYDKRWE